MGIFFSSFNLKTDASLKSIYSSILSILLLVLIFSFLKFKPNVIDSPSSNELLKLNRLEEKYYQHQFF